MRQRFKLMKITHTEIKHCLTQIDYLLKFIRENPALMVESITTLDEYESALCGLQGQFRRLLRSDKGSEKRDPIDADIVRRRKEILKEFQR